MKKLARRYLVNFTVNLYLQYKILYLVVEFQTLFADMKSVFNFTSEETLHSMVLQKKALLSGNVK